MNILTAKEFIKNYLKYNPDCKYDDVMIEFAKFHVEAALKKACEKSMINRKPTGDGQSSEEYTSNSFEGDLGYEDYIPVNYTINQESILNAYPLENIK
jgi:hypothetical protein